jgi:DNA-binding MarR family transcriptional regulator
MPTSPSFPIDDADAGAPGISKAEYEALAAFRYALRRFLHFSEEAAHKAGLTPQQHQALLAIVGFPGRDQITVGELAERLQIAHHSAVGLINRLVAHGLLVRQSGSGDARHVFLSVTTHGRELLEQLTAAHRAELQRFGPEFGELLALLRLRS